MSDQEPITIAEALRQWIEIGDSGKITEERLIKNLFREVKNEAIRDDIESVKTGKIKDEDIKELIQAVLDQRRLKHKKKEIWSYIEVYFDQKYGCHSKRTQYGTYYKKHHWSIGGIWTLFQIVYGWMPGYPRGRRPPREYPMKQLRELKAQGLSIRKISERTGISKSTVHRLLRTA